MPIRGLDRPGPIEITPAMIEAGIEAFADYDSATDSLVPFLREAFVEMILAGRWQSARNTPE